MPYENSCYLVTGHRINDRDSGTGFSPPPTFIQSFRRPPDQSAKSFRVIRSSAKKFQLPPSDFFYFSLRQQKFSKPFQKLFVKFLQHPLNLFRAENFPEPEKDPGSVAQN